MYSKESHHIKFDDLPAEIKPRAEEAIALADRIERFGLRQEISDEEYMEFDEKLKQEGL